MNKRTAILIIPEADFMGLLAGEMVVDGDSLPGWVEITQSAFTPGKGVKIWFEGEDLPEQEDGCPTPLLSQLTFKSSEDMFSPGDFLKVQTECDAANETLKKVAAERDTLLAELEAREAIYARASDRVAELEKALADAASKAVIIGSEPEPLAEPDIEPATSREASAPTKGRKH